MRDRVIPQRDLRNNIGAVLRETAAGASFTVTVHGKPMARLVPPGLPGEPRIDVDRETIRQILLLPADGELERDLDDAEQPIDDSSTGG